MPNERDPDLGLFFDILQTLESIEAPYMIIGAFAGTLYGMTRVTYDIDIIVDLTEVHLQKLAEAYPLPRYYADLEMMLNSIELGIIFNIIDTSRGEKADLVPLSSSYRQAFQRKIRQIVEIPGTQPLKVWCARVEDVIFGKLLAWFEGRLRKHETDIFEIMVFQYLKADPLQSADFDEEYLDRCVGLLGAEAVQLWRSIKDAALKEVNRKM